MFDIIRNEPYVYVFYHIIPNQERLQEHIVYLYNTMHQYKSSVIFIKIYRGYNSIISQYSIKYFVIKAHINKSHCARAIVHYCKSNLFLYSRYLNKRSICAHILIKYNRFLHFYFNIAWQLFCSLTDVPHPCYYLYDHNFAISIIGLY